MAFNNFITDAGDILLANCVINDGINGIENLTRFTVAGYTSGGQVPAPPGLTRTNIIDKFPFATDANATDVGDLAQARYWTAGQSSSVSGYTSGGASPGYSSLIDKFPFASNASASSVGQLSIGRWQPVGQSSPVSGYATSGYNGPGSALNTIDKFPFASDGTATDVGYLTVGRAGGGGGQFSSVSGYTSGGGPGLSNVIDKFPFAIDANATDVGDLQTGGYNTGHSSSVSGYASAVGFTRNIYKFPFATDANSTSVGNLTVSPSPNVARAYVAGQSSSVSGYTSGGNVPIPTYTVNIIDKFPFATDANATDVGDLSARRQQAAGQQV